MFLGRTKIDGLDKLIKAENLTKLSLSQTALTGTFPEELFSLNKLKEVLLINNNITGTLPSKISKWLYLERLDVTRNKLSGSLPSFKNLNKLHTLELSVNDWTGTLPKSLNKLPNLETLSLFGRYSKSKLTGSILDFANNTKLRELYLEDQNFTGSIPTSFLRYNINKDQKVEVNLAGNQLTGTLPQELGDRFDRLTIEITGNKITNISASLCTKDSWMEGEVKSFGCDAIACRPGTYANPIGRSTRFLGVCKHCTSLETSPYYGSKDCPNAINATDGTSSGSSSEKDILVKFFYSTNGTTWRNKKNWLDDSKSICSWIGVQCKDGLSGSGEVERLRLEFNELAGHVPTEIYELPFLRELSLSRNKDLTVTFTHIRKAKSLTTMYMAETKIVLDGIGKAPSLQILDVPNSGLVGSIPDEILEITTLQELDLSYNMFNGTLPTGISKLSQLTSLLLNNNEFTGSIPPSLGSLTNLKSLDLSVNGFEGSLPEELNNLINLEVLAIRNQNNALGFPSLTGELLDFNNLPSVTEIYLQDNALEGTIPTTFLMASVGRNDTIYVGLSRNQLNGTIPAELSELGHLLIALDDNNITGISKSLCSSKILMQGNVDKFGCDAILCPPGFYQKFSGRQTTDGLPCGTCQFPGGAPYFGSTSCVNAADKIARDILNKLYMETNGTLWYKVSSKETFCCRGLKIFATPSIDFLCVYLFDTLE
jgi:Leucine-rich repeat (LRR) protein